MAARADTVHKWDTVGATEPGLQAPRRENSPFDGDFPMSITRIEEGPRMSEAVVHNGVVYLAGQVGEAGQSVAEQTATALAEIERLLVLAGSSKAHMLTAMVWLADMADFEEMNSAGDAFVAGVPKPARATGQSGLADPAWRVEIVVTGAVK